MDYAHYRTPRPASAVGRVSAAVVVALMFAGLICGSHAHVHAATDQIPGWWTTTASSLGWCILGLLAAYVLNAVLDLGRQPAVVDARRPEA